MSKVVQEKFQVNYPQQGNDDAQSGWKSHKSARVKKGNIGREGRSGGDPTSRYSDKTAMFNSLPEGVDIDDQEYADIRKMERSGPMGNGSQVTNDLTAKSVRAGFDRKSLTPTDDMYTREHQDAFYEDVTVDGITGYLERNNMLDRS